MTSPYIAKRVKSDVPIWSIFAHGQDIGIATIFPYDDEGPVATVRYGFDDDPATFTGSDIRDVLAKVGVYLRILDAEMEALADAEYYSEVTGPMEAAEREAERYLVDDGNPCW